MLSFEISAMDLVLLVTMLVLLLLFVSQRKSQSIAESRLNLSHQNKPVGGSKAKGETAGQKSFQMHAAEGFQKCVHRFGYLKDMPKNTPVPDECFGCPKVLRCMFPNE